MAIRGKYFLNLLVLSCFLAVMCIFSGGCGDQRLAGVFGTKRKLAHMDQDDAGSGRRIGGILPAVLESAGLHEKWTAAVPMGRATEIQRVFYHNARVFVVTNRNVLWALDGNKGTILWSCELADHEPSCSMPSYFRDRMLFVMGNDLVEVRQTDGRLMFPDGRISLSFPVSTSAVRSDTMVLVGGADKRFYCLSLPDGVPIWQSACHSEPSGVIGIDKEHVYYACRNNVIYGCRIDRREVVWQTKAAGLITGVVVDGGRCYVPSADTALYGFSGLDGSNLWPKYLAGGTLSELPVLTADSIYQPIWQSGLVCLNRKSGTRRWELPGGKALLAENDNVSYVMSLNGELTIMNNLTGHAELSFLVKDLDMYASNTEDELIFLANMDGTVVALMPN